METDEEKILRLAEAAYESYFKIDYWESTVRPAFRTLTPRQQEAWKEVVRVIIGNAYLSSVVKAVYESNT